MSSTSWRKNSTIIGKLTEQPYLFSFKQAVRILERSNHYTQKEHESVTQAVGLFMPPKTECVRFTTRQSFSFPSSEIQSLTPVKDDDGKKNQWQMELNFIGLTGSNGVLPYHYTETVLKRLKVKDSTIKAFYNLFNHRTSSIFFQASIKYFAPLEYECNRLHNKAVTDNFTKMLLSLVGLGTKHLSERLYTKDESLLYYAGLFNDNVRSASGLKQILESHFSLPVQIKEFVGEWQELIEDVRTRLPFNGIGQNNQLGRTVMLGKKGWFSQGKINIILGPLTKKQLAKFSPHTPLLKALDELVRLYIGFEHDYSFILQIMKKDMPQSAKFSSKNPPMLGWTTGLSTASHGYKEGNTIINIPVSVR